MGSIGETVNPAIMIMLGGAFSHENFHQVKWNKDVFIVLLTKLIIFPLVMCPFILFSNFNDILKIVLIVETAVPPAVNLVIINKRYANEQSQENLVYLLSNLVYTYFFSIISIPIVVSVFKVLGKIK